MRVLITGAGGFIGTWLCRSLLQDNHSVHAWFHHPPTALHQGPNRPIETAVDITDRAEVARQIRAFQPEVIYHLAAQSFPSISWGNPGRTFQVNVGGTLNLFHAVLDAGISPRILSVCSSAEYAPLGVPIRETDLLAPSTPYGHSKHFQDNISEDYASHLGLKIVRVRPFFLTGPGKIGDVSSDFARRFVEAGQNGSRSIRVGSLEIVRDFLDVRDGVAAMKLLCEHATPGAVYNICSGKGYRIGEIFDAYNRISGLDLFAEVNTALLRPVDELIKIGDPSRLTALGWKPTISFEQTLRDIFDYWKRMPQPSKP